MEPGSQVSETDEASAQQELGGRTSAPLLAAEADEAHLLATAPTKIEQENLKQQHWPTSSSALTPVKVVKRAQELDGHGANVVGGELPHASQKPCAEHVPESRETEGLQAFTTCHSSALDCPDPSTPERKEDVLALSKGESSDGSSFKAEQSIVESEKAAESDSATALDAVLPPHKKQRLSEKAEDPYLDSSAIAASHNSSGAAEDSADLLEARPDRQAAPDSESTPPFNVAVKDSSEGGRKLQDGADIAGPPPKKQRLDERSSSVKEGTRDGGEQSDLSAKEQSMNGESQLAANTAAPACLDSVPQAVFEKVRDFLHASGLAEYTKNFLDEGYDEMTVVCDMDLSDLTAVQISKPGHIRKFQKAVERYVKSAAAQETPAPTSASKELLCAPSTCNEGVSAVPSRGDAASTARMPPAAKRLDPQESSEQVAKVARQTSAAAPSSLPSYQHQAKRAECSRNEAVAGVRNLMMPSGWADSANESQIKPVRTTTRDAGFKRDGGHLKDAVMDPVSDVINFSKNLQKAQPMLDQLDGKDAVVLVGDTGVGKTTCFLFLAGCRVVAQQNGRGFTVEEVPEALARSRVSDEAKSVTDTIACWPALADEHATGIWVDTPGHHDTRSTTSDVAMSILIKEIAKRSASLRFVCFLNIHCLRNQRGSTSRDALDTLCRWVPDPAKHLQAFSFIFTAATDRRASRWSEEDIEEWREHLPDDIRMVKEGSSFGLQTIWEWIEDDLRKEQPEFAHIFVPHLASRGELIRMLLPPDASDRANESAQARCILRPGDVIQSGLSKAKEQAFRSSIENVVETVEGCMVCATYTDYEQVENIMVAMQWMADHLGKEQPFVVKAWQRALSFVKRGLDKASQELKKRIEDGTSPTSMSEQSESAVAETLNRLKTLQAISSVRGEYTCEDLRECLHQRLEALHKDFMHRVDGNEGQAGVEGVSRHPHCLLAWKPASEKADRLHMLCLQHVQETLSSERVTLLCSASVEKQWHMVAVLRALQLELVKCPASFERLRPEAEQAMQTLWARATSATERAHKEAISQLQWLQVEPDVGTPQLLKCAQLAEAIKVVSDAAKVEKEEMLEGINGGISVMLHRLMELLTEGVESASQRADARLDMSQRLGLARESTSLAGALKTDILNINAAAACIPQGSQCHIPQTRCEAVTSRAFEVLSSILDEVHRAVLKCEASEQLHETDAAALAKWLEDASAMEWLQEVDPGRGMEMQKKATTAKDQLLAFFQAKSEIMMGSLGMLQQDLHAFPSKEHMETLASQLNTLKHIVRFQLGDSEVLQMQCKRMVAEHLQLLADDDLCGKLKMLSLRRLHDLNAGGTERLLALMSMDWGFMQPTLPITQPELDTTFCDLHKHLTDLFAQSGCYAQKREIIDGLMPWHPSKLASKLPSCEDLRAHLHNDIDLIFQRGAEACDKSLLNWESIVADCMSKLDEIGMVFKECSSYQSVCKKSSSQKADLERKSKLKRSELDANIKAAIEDFDFEKLRPYLETPPPPGPAHDSYMEAVGQVHDCINCRHDNAIENVHDAPSVAQTIKLLQRAHEEIGSVLLDTFHTDLLQIVESVKTAMQAQYHQMLSDLDEDLRAEIGKMDLGAMVQKLSAAQLYWDVIEKNRLKMEEPTMQVKLQDVQASVDEKKQQVARLMDAFFSCMSACEASQGDELKCILQKIVGQSSNPEAQQLYEEWVEQLGQRLLGLHEHLREVLATDDGDAGQCVRIYKTLDEEWRRWLGDHLRAFRPCQILNLSEALAFAQKKHEEQHDVVRDSLLSEAGSEDLLAKLEKYHAPASATTQAGKWTSMSRMATGVVEMVTQARRQVFSTQNQYRHWQKLLLDNVDKSLQTFDRCINSRDVCLAGETLDVLQMVERKFYPHVTARVRAQIREAVRTIENCSIDLCKDLEQEISAGCTSGRAVVWLQELANYVRYLWPAAQYDSLPPELGKACRSMHQAVSRRIIKDRKEMDDRCAAENIDSLKASLEHSRKFAWVLVGGFAVYAEEFERTMGDVKDSSLKNALQALQVGFIQERAIMETARSLALLELSPDVTSVEEITRKKRQLAKMHHPDKGATEKIKERKEAVMRRINDASDALHGIPDLSCYHRHLLTLHSNKVHELFSKQVGRVKNYLQKCMYEEAKAILQELPKWQALDHLVRPSLDIDKLKADIVDDVASHAMRSGADARKHLEGRCYKSLQHNLTALVSLETTFGSSHQDIYEKLNAVILQLQGSIRKRIQESVDHARACLESPSDADMHGFAEDLIDLGVIWWEITDMTVYVHQEMCKLLTLSLNRQRELGTGYLLKLGMHLAKVKEDAGSVADGSDGTASRAAVAQRIVHEFSQFSIVHNILWNKAVQKMQKDPKACIEEIKVRQLVGDVSADLDLPDLKEGLEKYSTHYDGMLRDFLKGTLSLDDVVDRCLQKVAAMRAVNRGLHGLEVTGKADIPELLAYVFMHYTIASSGEAYTDRMQAVDEGSMEVGALEQGLKTPHNIQILAVLRFFGFGSKKPAPQKRRIQQKRPTQYVRLDNHLVQVRTGEGKSLILGSAATIFALLGFRVCCVCYSAHLSTRDEKAFERTFSDFRVACSIKYSQITTYSEDAVAAEGDIRSLTLKLLGQKRPQSQQGLDAHSATDLAVACSQQEGSGEVLLIDEVDVLWGPEFYGKTHDQKLQIPLRIVRHILQTLWDWRDHKLTVHQLRQHIKTIPEYAKLMSKFSGFEYVVKSQVDMMCSDLCEFLEGAPPHPVFDTGHGGRIGYRVMDGIEFGIVHGYKTAFAYLEHQASLRSEKQKKMDAALSLLVDCGQFSYNNITPTYVFGVSGTVEHLEEYQRSEIAKHDLFSYTVVPSVYGVSKFRFLNQQRSDPIKICEAKDFHHEIAMDINEKIQEDRAVIVFFADGHSLKSFRESSYCCKLHAFDVLEERLSDSEKQHRIKKAATTGQITLATAVLGRGSDFACYDEKLQKKGGLHVLQTFVSLDISEEVQIQGRTARQGKDGTYSLILRSEEIEEELGLQAAVLKNQSPEAKYQTIRAACRPKQSSKFEEMRKELEDATERDQVTRAYFEKVLVNDNTGARALFKDMYTRCIRGGEESQPCSFHYIICLDESGSMAEAVDSTGTTKHMVAAQAALRFVLAAKEMNVGTSSAVSLVMFNGVATVTCQELPLEEASGFGGFITANGGGTCFAAPLQSAMDLILSTSCKYQRQCILLYTDGRAHFPAEQAQSLSTLIQERHGEVDFFAIAEDSAQTLVQICEHVYQQPEAAQHCLSQVQPEQIAGKMIETLYRMNVGYVKRA